MGIYCADLQKIKTVLNAIYTIQFVKRGLPRRDYGPDESGDVGIVGEASAPL